MAISDNELFNAFDSHIKDKNITSGNYADYTSINGFVCCSWMDLHDDDGYGASEDNQHFTIKPLWWDSDARLLHVVDDNWVSTQFDGSIVKFNAYLNHTLVPAWIADKVVELNTTEFMEFKEWDESVFNNEIDGKIKLVWIWCGKEPEYKSNNEIYDVLKQK